MLGELLIVDSNQAFGSLINLIFNKICKAVERPWTKRTKRTKRTKKTKRTKSNMKPMNGPSKLGNNVYSHGEVENQFLYQLSS